MVIVEVIGLERKKRASPAGAPGGPPEGRGCFRGSPPEDIRVQLGVYLGVQLGVYLRVQLGVHLRVHLGVYLGVYSCN